MHRYIPLPFKADGFGPITPTHITVATSAVSAEIELATGRVTPKTGGYPRRPATATAKTLKGLKATHRETPEGPITELADRDGARASVQGELRRAVRSGDLVVAVVEVPGEGHECVGLALDAGQVVRLPASDDTRVAAEGPLAACVTPHFLHVFQREAASLAVVTVPIPEAWQPDLAIVEGLVYALSFDKLLVVNPRGLPFGAAHVAAPVTYAPLSAAGSGDPEPATVAFVLSEKVLVDHPRLQRLSMPRSPRSPEVARGDQVVLDDVREELPGLYRVYAWRKVGAAGGERISLPALELPAPEVAPIAGTSAAEDTAPTSGGPSDSARLAELAARHGFRAPALLLRLLAEREKDPIFRRWLDTIGLDAIEVRGLTADWDADPCLLAFAGLGSGDEYCLYVYPPWCLEGHEPPVVEFLHETNEIEFRALGFEAFFVRELKRLVNEGDADAKVVKMIRARLDLPAKAGDRGAAPSWLPGSAASRPRKVSAAIELAQTGDVVGAERALVQIYLRGGDAGERAKEELKRLYKELGWSLPLEHLQEASD